MLKLFRFLKPYTVLVITVLFLVFFQSIAELYLPTLLSDLVNVGVVHNDISYILHIGGWMLLVAAAGTLCAIVASYYSAHIAMGFGKLVRQRVFSKVEDFSLHEINQFGTASLITRTTNDVTQVQQVLMILLRMMVGAPMMFLGGMVMAVSKDAKLSLVLLAATPILAGVIFFIARQGIPLFKEMQVKLDRLNLVMREFLTGVRVIRAFNRNDYEQKRYQKANLDLTRTAIRVNQIMAALMPAIFLVMNYTTLAVLWFGGIRIDQGGMQVGDLMAFLQYVMLIMFSLVMVSMMFVMVPRASASAVRINAVLDTVPILRHTAVTATPTAQERRGVVEFQDVTFRYPGAEKAALSHISFRALPGQVTAIIGSTGSGKSTLLHLIPRFYEASEGKVLVDGLDVREWPQEHLRRKIGLVPQKAVLFTGTIADNIRFGKNDASEEEVRHAAEVAQASEFIQALPEGFQAKVSQGGTNLSGGQKQRLSIARALVRKADIYLFDDSFSALDFKTDQRLRAALRQETDHATVIIVAQRVNTIMDADQIIVLDEGRIAGIGNHRTLMQSCEVYREIVQSQLSGEDIA